MKTILLILLSISASAQVYIPDNVFKFYLLKDKEINTTDDLEISYEEAEAYTGEIHLGNSQVADMTGIEAFSSVTFLDCSNNDLTEIDISTCYGLEELWVYNNQLTELNVYGLTNLTRIRLDNSPLASVDLSSNTALNEFSCWGNDMLYLDLRNGNNENMTFFAVGGNPNLCIAVDDTAYANANWSEFKDSTARFSLDCTVSIEEKQKPVRRSISVYDILGRNVNQPNYNYILK